MKNQTNDSREYNKNISKEYKILILEDSEYDVDFMTRKLSKAGINFVHKDIDEGDLFENYVQSWQPDVIISDYNISGKYSGREALKFCKKNYPDIPFISVSGVISKKTEIELLINRADDVIRKDQLDRLPFAVKRVIREREVAQKLLNKNERLVDLLLEKEVLVKEIHQRVKNNLALFSSFLEFDKIREDDPQVKSALDANIIRLKAIRIVHDIVYDFEDYENIPIAKTLKKIFALHLNKEQISVAENDKLNSFTADISNLIPVGLFLNEILNELSRLQKTNGLDINLDLKRKNQNINVIISCPIFTTEVRKVFILSEERLLILKTLIEQFEGEIDFYPNKGLTIISFKKKY